MDDAERMTDALLEASRALVAVAARSFAGVADQLTLPEFRSLVVLHRVGPLPVTSLAERVGVHQSTATRIAARLKRRDLVSTEKGDQDRRLTVVQLTDTGRALVDDVIARRRADIAAIVRRLPDDTVLRAHSALQTFAEVLQEPVAPRPPTTNGPTAATWDL